MVPRRPTSVAKNKTLFPPDSLRLLSETFNEKFRAFLKNKDVICEGAIYVDELLVRVGFREKGSIRQYNFEASLDFDKNKKSPNDLIFCAVDAIDSMMSQYIEAEGDIAFPYGWTEYTFNDTRVWLKTSAENSDLEAQANALLGSDPDFDENASVEDLLEGKDINEDIVDQLFDRLRTSRNTH